MRVAVHHNLPPGGALRALYELVRRSSTEHEYDLYTLDLGRFDDFAYAHGRAEQHDLTPWVAASYRYRLVPAPVASALPHDAWVLTRLAWMDRVQRRIATDINVRGYDAVLVWSCHVTHSPWLLRHVELPSLYYMNEPRRQTFEAGYQAPEAGAPLLRRAMARRLERVLRAKDRAGAMAASRIATNSCYSAESIQRAYGRDASVCYLGMDPVTFDLAPDALQACGQPSVISVGALDVSKSHDLVVRALGLIPPALRPALDLAYERCDPSYRAEVQELADRTGVQLRLHCGISDPELAGLYQSASATVVAARLEPFGLVPLESAACGTPVVAVREGGFRETVAHGVNGYQVDRSASDLAEAISRVLHGGLGRTREQIRSSVVPQWGWDGAVKRLLEQLSRTAEEPR